MTDFEKNIYNTYLIVSRTALNQPYTIRKNFDKITSKTNNILKRLSYFFNKHNQIKIQTFFEAPYKIHNNENKYVSIDYYITRAAIKDYTVYCDKLEQTSPDNRLDYIKESLHFIGMFCLRNKISLDQYLLHKTGCIYSWTLHYKERRISIYTLFELGDVCSIIKSMNIDERDLFLRDLPNTVDTFKTRYYNATNTRKFVKDGVNRLQIFLLNNK